MKPQVCEYYEKVKEFHNSSNDTVVDKVLISRSLMRAPKSIKMTSQIEDEVKNSVVHYGEPTVSRNWSHEIQKEIRFKNHKLEVEIGAGERIVFYRPVASYGNVKWKSIQIFKCLYSSSPVSNTANIILILSMLTFIYV